MATKRCCCGPCYTYNEDFVRPDEDEELLVDHWHDCGDFSDWELTTLGPGETNGRLENLVAGAKLILNEMVGHPYGILRVHIQIIEGAIYRVHAYHGTFGTPCSGENTVVEVECTGTDEGWLRIIQGSTTLEEVAFSSISDDDLTICVGERLIEATLSSTDDTLRYCGEVSGYWFALEGVTHPDNDAAEAATQWSDLQYSDHWEHDKRCPRCSKHCCFPLFNQVIAGFRITIHDIEPGDCEDCATTLGPFDLVIGPDQDRCECDLSYYYLPTTEDPLGVNIDGPHGCDTGTSNLVARMFCDLDVERTIHWQFSVDPDDLGESEIQFSRTFTGGTAPTAVLDTHLGASDFGDERTCKYDNAWIEFEPILVDGCCSEIVEEMGFAVATTDAISPKEKRERDSRLINWVRWLRTPEDTGVGDTVERLLAKTGGRKIKKMLERIGVGCGCADRQKALNRKYPY